MTVWLPDLNIGWTGLIALRKHAYSNILKILQTKKKNFQIKNSDIFHISVQNIDCGYSLEPPRRGGSNEYPQSMFRAEIKKNNVYPCKPQFYYIKVGFMGVKIIYVCFRDGMANSESAMLIIREFFNTDLYFFAQVGLSNIIKHAYANI